jgi:membrane protein
MKYLPSLADGVKAKLRGLPGYRTGRALAEEIQQDDLFGLAAEMAYRFLFALFPLILVTAAAVGFAGDLLGIEGLFFRLLGTARPLLPPGIAQDAESYIDRLEASPAGLFLSIGFLGALWGAAGGVGTLIKALNRTYDVKRPRPLWQRQLLAVVLTIALPPLGLALLLAGILGGVVASALEMLGAGDIAGDLLLLLRWPAVIVLLVAGLSGIYHLLPNVGHPYARSLPGAGLAALGWLLSTRALEWYLANLANYEVTYGALGTAMGLMLWFYLVSLSVLVGAELNTVLFAANGETGPSRPSQGQ